MVTSFEEMAERDEEAGNRLQIILDDNGELRLEDFIAQLKAINKALEETDRVVNGRKSVYFRIVSLDRT